MPLYTLATVLMSRLASLEMHHPRITRQLAAHSTRMVKHCSGQHSPATVWVSAEVQILAVQTIVGRVRSVQAYSWSDLLHSAYTSSKCPLFVDELLVSHGEPCFPENSR
jgi:hypothetical protein